LRAIVFGQNKEPAFNRTISTASIRRANAVVTLSILSYFLFSMVIMLLEPQMSAKSLLFEVSSALFTVGSSLGVTPMLSATSKVVLICAMFLGRVGIISLLIGVTGNKHDHPVQYPTDNIIIN
ncbi:MAG: potassium transporter, partial [Muribaculum sp.]|nr:potassium transporter [Muribaculum sp.]